MESICKYDSELECYKKEKILPDNYYACLQIITFDILNNIDINLRFLNDSIEILDNNVKEQIFLNTYEYMLEDLFVFSEKDPACKGDELYIINSYLSFKAVVCYRISSFIYRLKGLDKKYRRILARCISEKCKIQTGIEIHPGASIGRRFIIDHGFGTVIGETCEIGDDCYILQNVILGSAGIASNNISKRHPTIGNNVEIGAFARILGAINIGDNVRISPYSIITSNIPSDSKVTIRNQLQLNRYSKKSFTPNISTIISDNKDTLIIYVQDLMDPRITVLDENLREVNDIILTTIFFDENHIKVKVNLTKNNDNYQKNKFSLKFSNGNKGEIILLDSIELKNIINHLHNDRKHTISY